jgi:flavin-binding protein dodecin
MSDHVYKTIEITGSSDQGIEAAVQGAVTKASQSLHALRWFEITDIRGDLDGSNIKHWQVSMKLGFTLEDDAGS